MTSGLKSRHSVYLTCVFNIFCQGKFAKFKKYTGHSAHVTNVRWTHDDKYLVSVGGADTAVMVWSHVYPAERASTQGESDESDDESEGEGGNWPENFTVIIFYMLFFFKIFLFL